MTGPPPVSDAGLVSRTLAFAIDGLLLTTAIVVIGTVAGLAISLMVPGDTHVHVGAGLVAEAIGAWWLVMGAYLACFWTLAAQTPGMRAMGLRIATLDGRLVPPGSALLRLAGMVLAAIPLMAGYAMILVDDRRRGLHDKLAGTRVLYVADEGDIADLQAAPAAAAEEEGAASTARRRFRTPGARPGTSAWP